MPINLKRGSKNQSGSWFNVGSPGQTETNRNPVHELAGQKVPGFRFDGSGRSFQSASVAAAAAARRAPDESGTKQGGDWFSDPSSNSWLSSKSSARKQASAQIAKIPFESRASHRECVQATLKDAAFFARDRRSDARRRHRRQLGSSGVWQGGLPPSRPKVFRAREAPLAISDRRSGGTFCRPMKLFLHISIYFAIQP
jgi:hypothetical protein